MKVVGRRADGALNLSVGPGMAVILRAGKKSPVIDVSKAQKLGPWYPADNSLGTRRALEEQLSLSHVVPLANFALGMSLDEQRDRMVVALRHVLGGPYVLSSSDLYIPHNGLGDGWVVYCQHGTYYGLSYGIERDGAVRFEGDAVEVTADWEALKAAQDADTEEPMSLNWFAKFKKKKAAGKVAAKPAVGGMQPMKQIPTAPAEDAKPQIVKPDEPDVSKPEPPQIVKPLYSVAAVTKPDVKIVKPIKA